jgi:MoxR-like ATPase
LWPIVLVPTREQQATARECLADVLAHSENPTLAAAAEEASLGPLARATRLVAAGGEALATGPSDDGAEAAAEWRLRLEGILREIDAGFAPEATPPELADIRARLVSALGQ